LILAKAAEMKKESGQTTTEIIGGQAKIAGLGKSLNNQQKVRGMMGSFVNNLNYQVERLEKYTGELQRFDARILNVPLRKAKMMIKGSANENILSMYLTDISNDAAKLSTGSSSSIAELSQSAQERWNEIHDPNLSIKELLKLVRETQQAAKGRLESADLEIDNTLNQISSKESKQSGSKRFKILEVK
jgi:hypothetical protein